MAIKDKKSSELIILDAAKKEFIANGYTGARMQAIADAANINKAMLHYYFRSKDLLFAKIMESSVSLMAANIIPALVGNKSVLEKLHILVHNYIDTVIDNPHIPMFILSELSRGQQNFQEQLRSKMVENDILINFIRQIKKEQETGELKPIPPKHLMLTVMSLLTFPFIAKPIFTNLLDINDKDYKIMMIERKAIVINILRNLLTP